MSDLSYMEKLLDGVEVEWKTLEDVGSFQRGKRFVKKDMISEGFPCIHYGEMYTHYGVWAKVTKSFVAKDLASKLRVAEYGDVVIVAAGETIEDIGQGTAWLGESSVVTHDACFSYKSLLNPKYVSYFLRTRIFHDQIKPYISSGKISAINAKGLGKAKIPIPSATVQAEIVRILDAFTELTAELTAELVARKQQYIHYRNKLMNIDINTIGVKQMSLGEIYHFQYGKGNTIPKTGGEYPVYGSNGIVGSHHEYNSEDAPVIGHIGAYAGIVNWGKGKHFVTYNGVICRMKSEDVLPQYAYYILLLQNFGEKSNSASQPFVSYHILEAPIVSIPSLDEQQRIVAILDKFSTLTTSLTEGLPREIELRQQQYEYYRELLLSFPKPEVADHD